MERAAGTWADMLDVKVVVDWLEREGSDLISAPEKAKVSKSECRETWQWQYWGRKAKSYRYQQSK